MYRFDRIAAGVGLCILLCGCGGGNGLETAPATGQVLYNGKPLPYGTVSFRPKAGSPATGVIQTDGSFTLTTYRNGDGAILGMHEVLINATEHDAGIAAPVQPDTEMLAPKSLIPEKYMSFSTSGITAEVKQGEKNHFQIEMRD
ncbi:hypothetical protein [Blastopirellula marina]|uniref:Carboxypeptidase regulatory-like domain-containing protein n=1 Tax=Blastopirellula marina DSM 3645 TaxID=314230 RepID=A3ZNC4_9BACT|nr:hypothetical protein [Blastopirellula marina]EAQ81819.1 hypothetical protein DSM3645_16745 [Blastopirellula marina DSM 3645]